nr:hypothetical protein [Tanacetum cinerariifolium]
MFQFDSSSGMEKVMEDGPWRIQLGLDAHTNYICLHSWGRSDYARALVEVSADKPLVDSVDIDIPREDGNGYIMANIRIEFEWQPPRCG